MPKDHSSRLDDSLKILAKTSVVVLIGVVLSKLFTWLYRIVVARTFGPEIYGVLALATMVAGILVALFSFGLNDGLTRFIPLYRGKNQEGRITFLFRRTMRVVSIAGIFGVALMFFSADYVALNIFHSTDLVPFLQILSLLVPITIISSVFLSVLRGYEKIGWYSFIINIVQNVSKFLLLVLFIFFGLQINSIIFSTLIGAALTLLIGYIVLKRVIPNIFTKNSNGGEGLKEVFSYSWPLLILGVISVVNYWADSFALGYFRNTTEVGLYNAAVPLALLLLLVPDLFLQLFFPLITREFGNKNHDQIKELSKQVTKWIAALNLPLFTILITFPGTIINIFFDARFLAAEQALRLLAIGALMTSLATVPSTLLSMIGKSRLILINTLSALVLNIILNALWVPNYGMNGAALATMISYIFLYICFLTEARYILGFIPLRRKMINLFVISGLLLGFIFILKQTIAQYLTLSFPILAGIGIIYLVLYALLVMAFGLDKHDDKIIKMLKNKAIFETTRKLKKGPS